jgi:hypothetical protein
MLICKSECKNSTPPTTYPNFFKSIFEKKSNKNKKWAYTPENEWYMPLKKIEKN